MKRLFKRNRRLSKENNPSQGLFEPVDDASAFFPDFIETLLLFLKEFSIEATELDTDEFRSATASLAKKIKAARKVKEVSSLFEKKRKAMALFIQKQNWYLTHKESEYKDMIDLLSRAVAKTNMDNDAFSEKMLEQSSKIEKVSSLSDIKEIKGALKNAIEEIREKVKEKQVRDSRHMAQLTQKVETLSVELKKAEKGSLRDELTGVYNMNAFKNYIREALENDATKDAPLVMGALDIDAFDKIVNCYSNKIGNRVLLAFADKCREFLKSEDFAARYKGGLFVLLIFGESPRKVAKRAKQFCKSIEKEKYTLDEMRSENFFSFTVSVGLTPYLKNDTPETMIRRSLGALKSAKEAGGNRIQIDKG